MGVLFCVCYFSYFKAISHVVLISSTLAFCVQIVYWSSCFYWLHTRNKWQTIKFLLFAFGAVLLGSSVSFSFHNVSYLLLVASQEEKKINRVGLMIVNCN